MMSKQERDLDPNKDDLPLRANTNHMLVRHYVLDLTVDFQRKVIGGNIVLFLEPGKGAGGIKEPGSVSSALSEDPHRHDAVDTEGASCFTSTMDVRDGGPDIDGRSEPSWDDSREEFTLILDCCDLLVSKVEEVDVSTVPELRKLLDGEDVDPDGQHSSFVLVQRLISIPSNNWRQQQDLYLRCSYATGVHAQSLPFHMDQWSLQVRKRGVRSPCDFPRVLRICYETKPTGGSVRWTKDQDDRGGGGVTPGLSRRVTHDNKLLILAPTTVSPPHMDLCCVYTMGSPINNRALFPCQEPPVAMSTWQARVKAPCEYTVLLSGENQAMPMPEETDLLQWDYYVTMPMPASTFTLAVGKWQEARAKAHTLEEEGREESCAQLTCRAMTCPEGHPTDQHCENQSSHHKSSAKEDDEPCSCSHVDYPCRFRHSTLRAQVIIPHRVFAPLCHLQKAETFVLPLLPLCLAAAHSVLGVHPFSRLDVLIVPPGFSSLGMARTTTGPPQRTLPAGLCPQDSARRTLPTGRCPQDAAGWIVLRIEEGMDQRREGYGRHDRYAWRNPTALITNIQRAGSHPVSSSTIGCQIPHIIFLSQSVLAGERGLCGARLCHEIAHSWFGLAIGARDWTEEWISEGFATYLEDVFWAKVQQLDSSEDEEQRRLKALLRWRRLKDELENSEEELQVLRPNKDTTGEVSESGASVVKHALNPGKPFMQVHYLKGYFLLKFLASKVGEDEFLSFFRRFVRGFHGQLILSQDFLQMFLDTFPALSSQGLTLGAIYSDWLDTPDIPKWLEGIGSTWTHAQPVGEVKEEVVKWVLLSSSTGKGTKRKRAGPKVNFKEAALRWCELQRDAVADPMTGLRAEPEHARQAEGQAARKRGLCLSLPERKHWKLLSPERLVLLLEFLLEEAEISVPCLSLLQTTYDLRNQDAEVKHRWCELVVKHKYTAAYRDVEHFLIHDQNSCTQKEVWDCSAVGKEDKGYGCVSVRRADASGRRASAGFSPALPLSHQRGHGPISTQRGGGNDPVTQERRRV
ncbi:hypothetical protein NFI96_021427 [Prochilodus magdalenae]|nr:hypothetical protein NFI96_021427 [Prochilodus magdalenae]